MEDKAEVLAQIMYEEDNYNYTHGKPLVYFTLEDFLAEKAQRELKWIFVEVCKVGPNGFTQYVSTDGKFGKIVYNDGYEEIYELA